ncbi:MAG: type II toxin-antitoxin system PemK/MazF family toxin [Alphaproteobacteria bacterium]
MKRGDIVTVSLPGDYGKPRPALVVRSDLFDEHPSLTVLPITSHLVDAPLLRIPVGPECGLDRASQIQIDKAQTPRRERIRSVIGHAGSDTLQEVNRALAVFLGLA